VFFKLAQVIIIITTLVAGPQNPT